MGEVGPPWRPKGMGAGAGGGCAPSRGKLKHKVSNTSNCESHEF